MDSFLGRWQAYKFKISGHETLYDRTKGHIWRFNEDGSVWWAYHFQDKWHTDKENIKWEFRNGIYQTKDSDKITYTIEMNDSELLLLDPRKIMVYYLKRIQS